MIAVLFLWLIVGFNFLMTGFITVKILKRFTGRGEVTMTSGPDMLFFTGFMILSVISGFISLWLPVGNSLLLIVSIISAIVLVTNLSELKSVLKDFGQAFLSFGRKEQFIFLLVTLFILTAVVHKITLGDTESYHAQSIQWVRKYAVVPGLGNIHGRLAFNSMFFVISGMFTFQFKDILIYPINGICFLVLSIKLISLGLSELKAGSIWKATFYFLLMLISIFILLPDLNSPAPDVICSIIIMYVFAIIIKNRMQEKDLGIQHYILINLLVFTCISYKLSSLFLVITLMLFLNRNIYRRILLSVIVGIIVLSPFFIRNFYLSGYLVYPYPNVDLFNVDWKIPINSVHEMKIEIGSWAKIPSIGAGDVDMMRLHEWAPVWFKTLSFNNKILVIMNLLGFFLIPISIFRKDYFISLIQLIILLNVAFWVTMAPDPRFAYGFLFTGFSLSISYFTGLFEKSFARVLPVLTRIAIGCFIVVILGRRIMFPVGTIINPSLWVIPASFGTVESNEYDAGFKYRVPVPEGGCFNIDIPCVPYPLNNIVMRGDDLQDGFKVYPYPGLSPKGKEQ